MLWLAIMSNKAQTKIMALITFKVKRLSFKINFKKALGLADYLMYHPQNHLRNRVHMKVAFSFLLLSCFFTASLIAQGPHTSKIDPLLAEIFADESNAVDCIIIFSPKADLRKAKKIKNKNNKGRFVYEQLKNTALKSQKNTLSYLRDKKKNVRSFYLVNAIATHLTKDEASELASLPEIESIVYDPDVKMEEPIHHAYHKNNSSPEWGLQMINADSVWQMGYMGQDVVIAGQDTGYEWEHPALVQKYRGNKGASAVHDYNWHDAIHEINPAHNDSVIDASANPCGLNVPYPCDDHNHGTHTMGTMVGSDSLNLIGVAPAAKWIACRNMERGIGKPSTYIECFEWFLAPTDLNGNEARPELAPDVVNNSWSCPEAEGCNEGNWNLMREAIQNLKSAGVMVVVSAGNDGRDGCGTIAKAPAMFKESFAVGATRSNDTIAAFSSRGPVVIDSSFLLKPDVSAPGHNVRSCIRNGAYANYSGTSMAGPHVAGAVALILSANPDLRGEVEILESILMESAHIRTDSTECFDNSALESPNPVYGHGRIDVLKAVEMALSLSTTSEVTGSQKQILLYPNPTQDWVMIKGLDKDEMLLGLNIYDNSGRLVKTVNRPGTKINLSEIETGLYYIQIRSSQSLYIKKLIVSH